MKLNNEDGNVLLLMVGLPTLLVLIVLAILLRLWGVI